MTLAEYRQKRRFRRTPEPQGKRRAKAGHRFVVQKHAATRLHYDFRLELDGVLKSWAIPKGPSLDPRERRLAVQVEDHPLEYANFEGVIPQGEYGGGTVIIWDRGVWKPIGDPQQGYRDGKLKFELRGKKLRGGWMLVRMPRRERAENWLLMKERDDEARPVSEYDVTAEEPDSVASGLSLDEVARLHGPVWTSNRKEATAGEDDGSSTARLKTLGRKNEQQRGARTKTKTTKSAKTAKRSASNKKSRDRAPRATNPAKLVGARQAKLPERVEAELATLVKKPPDGERWLHEIKFDGYRILARLEHGKARLWSRNGLEWTAKFPYVAKALGDFPVQQAWLDGELVALEPSGISSFQALQNSLRENRGAELVYHVFDLLYLDGYDLRGAALGERKNLLAHVMKPFGPTGRLRYTEHFEGDGGEFFRQACRLGLEGIISKNRNRPYLAGRTLDWLKTKCVSREEFVIGGFTEPAGSRKGLGSLLVGYYTQSGDLRYAGRVGTGFSDALLGELRSRLDKLQRREPAFSDLRPSAAPKGTHWVKPELVAQVEFSNWTRDQILRHPSFQGLREDKPAESVRRDVALENGKAPSRSKKKRTSASQPPMKTRSPSVATDDEVAGVRITHPERVLYPEQGITKIGLARYYAQIADWMLPYLEGRPLTLVRCPQGRRKDCFYQKHIGRGAPEALRSIPVPEKDKVGQYLVVDNVQALVSLIQIGILELHIWPAREDELEKPDLIVFDFDPDPAVPWTKVVRAVHEMRKLMSNLGLESFAKTTGGKGLHLVIPIRRRQEWPVIKGFARKVAEHVATQAPDRYTTNMSKAARQGKIFIDYLRNERGATFVCPYSTRAKQGAPVSTPLAWDEVTPAIRSDHFNVDNLPARLSALQRDPWKNFFTLRQSLTAAMLKEFSR